MFVCMHMYVWACTKLAFRFFCEMTTWSEFGVCVVCVCRQGRNPHDHCDHDHQYSYCLFSRHSVPLMNIHEYMRAHKHTYFSFAPPFCSSSISTAAKQWRNVPACYHSSVAIWWRKARDNPRHPYQWQGSHFHIQAPLADKSSPW